MLIRRKARKPMAEQLRQFALGRISNFEFKQTHPTCCFFDRALKEIPYYLYSENQEYRLVKKNKLSPAQRKYMARVILFLQSGYKYRHRKDEYMPRLSHLFFIMILLVLGVLIPQYRFFYILAFIGAFVASIAKAIIIEYFFKEYEADESVWPFYSRAQYKYALAHPVYLAGKHNAETIDL